MKKAAVATAKFVKVAVKAIVAATKAVIAGVKALIAAIAAGGWVAVLVIVIVVVIAAIIGSVYAIFAPASDDDIQFNRLCLTLRANGERSKPN